MGEDCDAELGKSKHPRKLPTVSRPCFGLAKCSDKFFSNFVIAGDSHEADRPVCTGANKQQGVSFLIFRRVLNVCHIQCLKCWHAAVELLPKSFTVVKMRDRQFYLKL